MAEDLILYVQTCTQNNCTKLQVVDVTGLTSSPADGSGKWGDVIDRSDITTVTIQIVLPNGSDLFATPLDVTSTIKTSTDEDVYYTPFVSSGTKFTDGIYQIIYNATVDHGGGEEIFEITRSFTITCNYQCCVDSMWALLPEKMCNKCDYMDYLNLCLEADAYLEALNASACCGDTNAFDSISELLDKICNINSNCNCG